MSCDSRSVGARAGLRANMLVGLALSLSGCGLPPPAPAPPSSPAGDTGLLELCLDDGPAPPFAGTWSEVVEEPGCLHTGRCADGTRFATPVGRLDCYGSITGYFDGAGDRVALHEATDTNAFCGGRAFDRWWGIPVACEVVQTAESAGCALPIDLVGGFEDCELDPAGGPPWADLAAALAAIDGRCAATASCDANGVPAVAVVDRRDCAGHWLGVFDAATGARLTAADLSTWLDPTCDTNILWFGPAAWGCFAPEWAPSAGCGVVP